MNEDIERDLHPDDLSPELRAVWEWLDPEGYLALNRIREYIKALEHLHDLDHSLADQWQARAERAEDERDKALEELSAAEKALRREEEHE